MWPASGCKQTHHSSWPVMLTRIDREPDRKEGMSVKQVKRMGRGKKEGTLMALALVCVCAGDSSMWERERLTEGCM